MVNMKMNKIMSSVFLLCVITGCITVNYHRPFPLPPATEEKKPTKKKIVKKTKPQSYKSCDDLLNDFERVCK